MDYVTLSNGVKMPILGYGVYQVTQGECERCVMDALEVGYRSIDTAQSYFNEEQVGSAIQKSGVKREDIFLTSKVWVEHYGYDECRKSVEDSLRKLQTDYIDLMLLHQPFADYYGAYRALEDMYDEGKLRAIGISNFYPDRMVDIVSFARIHPMVNQVETHPHNQQTEAKKWMDKYGVQIEAWAPFGEGRGGLFTNEVLAAIGKKYGKTTAQVMLRWNIQRDVVVLPKSTHKDRMIENLNVFDFTLSDEDMAAIAALDTATSSFFSHYDPNMVEWFVKMVKERKQNHDSSKEKKNWQEETVMTFEDAKAAHAAEMPFPIGAPNGGFKQYFIGQSFLAPVSTSQVGIFNVTFEPGCRNNWHIHHADRGGGQILICVAGRGYYQEWGKDAIEMKPGDCVNIPEGVKHWHGAAPDSWFSHLAVEVPGENGKCEWLEPVSDEEYSTAARSK